jgi:hypothetical protein
MAMTAPVPAMSAPVDRDIRRPRAAASRARGTAATAAPRVLMVAAMPDHAGDPESCAASREPRDNVAPMPMPPRIWPPTRTERTLRCGGGPTARPASGARGRGPADP